MERERRADELRAEERAARARLAELEDAAARRQIEVERARVEALAEQLRQAELAEQAVPEVAAEPPSQAPEVVPIPASPIEQSRVFPPPLSVAGPPTVAESRPAEAALAATRPRLPWFAMLIVVALVLGVVSLIVHRSVDIDGSLRQFNELGRTAPVDAIHWLFVLAIGVPLLLGNHPVEQRLVLVGVTVSLFLFELLYEVSSLRFGFSGWSEGSWFVARILQIVSLVVACRIVRRHSTDSTASSRRRVPLVLIAIAGGLLTFVAIDDEWNRIPDLFGYVIPGRSPLAAWFLLVALPPIVVTVALAARGSHASQVVLATIATFAALNFFAEARLLERYDIKASHWHWASVAYLLLAGAAWWAAIASGRSKTSTTRQSVLT